MHTVVYRTHRFDISSVEGEKKADIVFLTAAQLGGAPFGLRAQDSGGVFHGRGVRAGVVRAECLAARASSAPGLLAHFRGGAADGGEPVGARVRRAEFLAALFGGAHRVLAEGGVGL